MGAAASYQQRMVVAELQQELLLVPLGVALNLPLQRLEIGAAALQLGCGHGASPACTRATLPSTLEATEALSWSCGSVCLQLFREPWTCHPCAAGDKRGAHFERNKAAGAYEGQCQGYRSLRRSLSTLSEALARHPARTGAAALRALGHQPLHRRLLALFLGHLFRRRLVSGAFTGFAPSLVTTGRPRCVSVVAIAVVTKPVVSPMVPRVPMVAVVTPSLTAAVPLHPPTVVLSVRRAAPPSAAVVVCASSVGRHGRIDRRPTTTVDVITRALVARGAEVVAILDAFERRRRDELLRELLEAV